MRTKCSDYDILPPSFKPPGGESLILFVASGALNLPGGQWPGCSHLGGLFPPTIHFNCKTEDEQQNLVSLLSLYCSACLTVFLENDSFLHLDETGSRHIKHISIINIFISTTDMKSVACSDGQ